MFSAATPNSQSLFPNMFSAVTPDVKQKSITSVGPLFPAATVGQSLFPSNMFTTATPSSQPLFPSNMFTKTDDKQPMRYSPSNPNASAAWSSMPNSRMSTQPSGADIVNSLALLNLGTPSASSSTSSSVSNTPLFGNTPIRDTVNTSGLMQAIGNGADIKINPVYSPRSLGWKTPPRSPLPQTLFDRTRTGGPASPPYVDYLKAATPPTPLVGSGSGSAYPNMRSPLTSGSSTPYSPASPRRLLSQASGQSLASQAPAPMTFGSPGPFAYPDRSTPYSPASPRRLLTQASAPASTSPQSITFGSPAPFAYPDRSTASPASPLSPRRRMLMNNQAGTMGENERDAMLALSNSPLSPRRRLYQSDYVSATPASTPSMSGYQAPISPRRMLFNDSMMTLKPSGMSPSSPSVSTLDQLMAYNTRMN